MISKTPTSKTVTNVVTLIYNITVHPYPVCYLPWHIKLVTIDAICSGWFGDSAM